LPGETLKTIVNIRRFLTGAAVERFIIRGVLLPFYLEAVERLDVA